MKSTITTANGRIEIEPWKGEKPAEPPKARFIEFTLGVAQRFGRRDVDWATAYLSRRDIERLIAALHKHLERTDG